MATTEETRRLSELIRGYTDEELTTFRSNRIEGSIDVILADKEFERRARLAQHELDRKLMLEQVGWMKFASKLTAASTLIAAIVGAAAGALITFWLQPTAPSMQSGPQTPRVQQQSETLMRGDLKDKATSVPSKPLETKSLPNKR